MTTRRDLLTGLGALALSPSVAQASAYDLVPRGTAAIVAEAAPVGRYGFILIDVETGKRVDGSNEDELFIPASLSKIPTSFAAMHVHGPHARFSTEIRATGPIVDGVLDGDLLLIGGGDPSLETADLVDLVLQLQAAGLRQVNGRFIYYGAALPQSRWLDRTQPWQAPYNPSMGGLNLNYNRVQFRWSREGDYLTVRGAAVSDGRVMRAPSVQFQVSREGPEISHQTAGGLETWTLRQSLLTGRGNRWLPVRDPGAFTAGVFAEVCAEGGIILPMPEAATVAMGKPKGKEIAIHRSDPVFLMLRGMMKYSNNLTAEALGASAGYVSGSKPRSINRAARLTTLLTAKEVGKVDGQGWNGFGLENHSGLSVRSRATPRQMAFTLREAHKRWGDMYLALFNNQTMTRERMGLLDGSQPPEHMILGKTGSMHFVRGLAGFIKVGGRMHTYAFMANEDDSREILDAKFEPYGDVTPPAARNWSRRTKAFERQMLADWVKRYAL